MKAIPKKGDPRLVSLAGLAKLIARDRNTLMKWINEFGCPVIQKADRAAGIEWQLDVAEVVRWREDYVARLASEAVEDDARPGEDGENVTGYDEARRREKVAQATMAEISLDERLGEVILISDVTDLVTQEYAVLRAALQTLGGAVAPHVAGLTNAAEIQAVIDEAVIDALGALARDEDPRKLGAPSA